MSKTETILLVLGIYLVGFFVTAKIIWITWYEREPLDEIDDQGGIWMGGLMWPVILGGAIGFFIGKGIYIACKALLFTKPKQKKAAPTTNTVPAPRLTKNG